YDYPLYLKPVAQSDKDSNGNEVDDTPANELACPMGQFIHEQIETFADGDGAARILKDNVPWIERFLREELESIEGPVSVKMLIEKAAKALQGHLTIDEGNRARLQDDLNKLLDSIPEGGELLAYGRYPALHLLIHVIKSRVMPRQTKLKATISSHIQELNKLLAIDKSHSKESTSATAMKESIGGTTGLFNPDALSSVMKHTQGSIKMPDARRVRIEKALAVLEAYHQDKNIVRFIHNGSLKESWIDETDGFESIENAEPCAAATQYFDESAGKLAELFSAVRIADLEIANIYDESIHNPWFENFNWETFSQEELLLVPAIIALESADHVAGSGMPALSQLLSSGRPVQIFVRVLAHGNPGVSQNEDPFKHYRTELGYFGISHRQAVVSQASAARHQDLLRNFSAALGATRTSLHLINVGLRPSGEDNTLNAWLVAGAALEGRVHPSFLINPGVGDDSLERIDFSGNPQQELDWPIHDFVYLDRDGEQQTTEQAFTFADYALLIPKLNQHFAYIPESCESEELIELDDFFMLSQDECAERVPFVWAVDSDNQLHRLVVSRALVLASLDRLNFWRTLQAMAGVRSSYIDIAAERARESLREEFDKERAELLAQYESEIESIRANSASEVMGRLTEVLLGMDLSSGALPTFATSQSSVTASPAAEATAEEVTEEPVAEAEVEEDGGFDEAWIDSPLCTSCNDCLDINPIMFVYNDENLAYITDPAKGTYRQMVEAAEICPSKCIHPGKPVDSSEANLEELIARAAPFN
ncbi:MAG: ferredoxin, partial [Gammaproteobacteria bacterium]|nr:ferredoxin [Gammaproteobacteria bacterium]